MKQTADAEQATKRGPGRPPKDQKFEIELRVLVSKSLRGQVEESADAAGVSIAAWIRTAAAEKLERDKARH